MLTVVKLRFGVFASLVCSIVLAHAQGRTDISLDHQSWSTETGLPQNSIHQILQSRDGYLWLATEGGLVRYDGMSFKVFDHDADPAFTSNDLTSLAEDRAGNLWIGSADGLIEYSHSGLRRFGPAEGLPSADVISLAIAGNGYVAALTSEGVAAFNGLRFRPVAGQLGFTQALQTDNRGSLVLIGDGASFRFSKNQVSPLDLGVPRLNGNLRGFVRSPDGATWVWSDKEVVASRSGTLRIWSSGRDLPGTRVQCVYVDRKGGGWIGTNRGLVTVSNSGGRPEAVEALGSNSILSMLQDAEGNIWIGTETTGLHALRPRMFREQSSFAGEEISAIVQASDGTVWVGTRNDGLRRLHRATASAQSDRPVANKDLTSPVILSLAPGAHGDVWVGTPDGLTHVDAAGTATRYTSSDGLPDDFIRSLLIARDGSVWIGTRRGVAHLQKNDFQALSTANGLGGDLIGTLYESDGRDLWIATLAGLSRVRSGSITNFTAANGLVTKLVSGIVGDGNGRLWIASRDAGLFLFDGNRFRPVRVAAVTQEIFGITADRQGFLWLRVRHGVLRVLTDDLARCGLQGICKADVTRYGMQDGMQSEEFVPDTEPSAWRTATGQLWFATRKGIAIADPALVQRNNVPPPVVIERFLADNDEVALSSDFQSLPRPRGRYTFEYAGLSYTIPSKVLYRTRLEGYDQDWSAPTTRRSVSYTNLAPGTYTFRVQAANNDGLWNTAGAELRFRILPPIYRRWWFLLSSVLALIALSVFLYRLRLRRLQLRFDAVLAERNRIAREIHDTLAQDFVGVSLQLDLISQLLATNKVTDAARQVNATRRLVKSGLEEARQSIWNLRASSKKQTLPSRVTALAQRFSTADLIVKAKIGGAYRELPTPIEDEVLRIMQEAITNVQRHASATAVDVRCQYQPDKLVIEVQDDGHGFSVLDGTGKVGHFGLEGMRERATCLGGELSLVSATGAGTVVQLVVPVQGGKGSEG